MSSAAENEKLRARSEPILGLHLRWWVLASVLAAALPFLLLAAFNHPSSDDYCYSASSREMGSLNALTHYYARWTGRFFSTAVLTVNPLVFEWMRGYKLMTLALLALIPGSIFLLVRSIFPAHTRRLAAVMAAVLAVLFLSGMPSVSQGVYWMAGAVTYQLGIVLALLAVVGAIRAGSAERQTVRIAWASAAASASVAAVGSSETTMVILLGVVCTVGLLSYRMRGVAWWPWLIVLAAGALAAAIVISAPGNATRLALMHARRGLWWSLTRTVTQSGLAILDWVSQAPLLIATIMFVPIVLTAVPRASAAGGFRALHPAVGILATVGIVAAAIFPPLWFTGDGPAGRTLNAVYLFFLLGWFLSVYLVVVHMAKRRPIEWEAPGWVAGLAAVLLLCSLFTPNVRAAYGDVIRGRAIAHEREHRARYALIERAREDSLPDLEVPPLAVHPRSMGLSEFDLTADPDSWINRCHADYFGVQSLRIPGDSGSPHDGR